MLCDPDVPRWLSAVSLWEIAVKIQIGKLDLPQDEFYLRHSRALKAQMLDVSCGHSLGLFDLPLHHKDPFDRMLVSQARAEDMILVTHDPFIRRYDVQTIWT